MLALSFAACQQRLGWQESVRERQVQRTEALEYRLAKRIVLGEELRQRLLLLDYYLDLELHDLWRACRWADRIERCEGRLAETGTDIRRLWQDVWQRVAQAMANGGEILPLDRFFFWARNYLELVLAGELSFTELDAGYDWERECFRPEFVCLHRRPSKGALAEGDEERIG